MEDGAVSVAITVTILFNSFPLSPEINTLKLCKGQPSRPLPVKGQNFYGIKMLLVEQVTLCYQHHQPLIPEGLLTGSLKPCRDVKAHACLCWLR